jgi:hypothetical protein
VTRSLLLAAAIVATGCSTLPSQNQVVSSSISPAEERQVRAVLERLYRSFNYGQGEEPEWQLMRSCFLDGALFAPEPEAGGTYRPLDVDALIRKWQASIRKRPSENAGYSEWIDQVSTSRVGNLIRADVTFYGKEATDSHPRKPGLDSLQLVKIGGDWKVLSFVVQYESKL